MNYCKYPPLAKGCGVRLTNKKYFLKMTNGNKNNTKYRLLNIVKELIGQRLLGIIKIII